MFDHLEIRVLPRGPRYAPQLRFRVNGEDVVEPAVGPGGCGPFSDDVFPADRPSPLRAGGQPHRVQLGQPECTGGCCGYLSAVVQRSENVVLWSDWLVPADAARPLEYAFDADQYDAELTRIEADPWWRRKA
ncbi:hypothetical protein [Kitasatospora sp. NPDC017646]|uniref:hypothetical protein n=1 Tax=Kitasatospora sp. NPDC017646 TaxID=3364024 RepID=UPI00378CB48A